jgi:hypothetical protein
MKKESFRIYEEWTRESGSKTPAQVIGGRGIHREGTSNSVDPSWDLLFEDGSTLQVGNPHEECFDGNLTPSNFDHSTDFGKLRRQIEDRLRKDSAFLCAVAEIFTSPFWGGKI